MASYCSEIQYLVNHVQSAEQHNQDVNSLGLKSARKTAEGVENWNIKAHVFNLPYCFMSSNRFEAFVKSTVKNTMRQVAREILNVSMFLHMLMTLVMQHIHLCKN